LSAGEGPMPLDEGLRLRKAERDRERLDGMVRYAFSRGCRTRFIYDYFAGGARGGVAPRCGTCDVCLGWGRAAVRPVTDDELLKVRIALSGVGRLSGRFGVERIAQVLTGSRVRQVLDRGLDQIPTYGKLAMVPPDEVKDLLNVLADAGLIARQGIEGGRPGAFVLALTPEGRQVAMGQVRPELAFPVPAAGKGRSRQRRARVARGAATRSAAGPRPDGAGEPGGPSSASSGGTESTADPAVLARLKDWRREEARRQGKPPYVIFHDSTLEALATSPPRDRTGLQRIRGIGPGKLEAYGEALLQLLA
jgi:ATP-dependent DNA helicase RecQ